MTLIFCADNFCVVLMKDKMETDHQHKKWQMIYFLVNLYIKDITAKYRLINKMKQKNDIEIDEISSLPHNKSNMGEEDVECYVDTKFILQTMCNYLEKKKACRIF